MKNLRKVAVGVVRKSRKFQFQGTHIWGTLCSHLCDSTAFLSTVNTAIRLVSHKNKYGNGSVRK